MDADGGVDDDDDPAATVGGGRGAAGAGARLHGHLRCCSCHIWYSAPAAEISTDQEAETLGEWHCRNCLDSRAASAPAGSVVPVPGLGWQSAAVPVDGSSVGCIRDLQRGNQTTSTGTGLSWQDVLEILEGRSALVGVQLQRPHRLQLGDRRRIFVERPIVHRKAKSDKWRNSGGTKGSTVHWVDDRVGIRKKYGKMTGYENGLVARYAAFTLIRDLTNPQDDNSVVAFVMLDPTTDVGSNQARLAAAVPDPKDRPRRGSATWNTQPRAEQAVLDVRVQETQSRFISFQMDSASHDRTPGMSIELGAIVKHGKGVKLESGQGDFAEWHRKRKGEPPFEEGDVVGFDGRGQISRRTNGARMLGVVSRKAIVEGSAPLGAERADFDVVAYVGVVPVKVLRRTTDLCDRPSQTGPRAGDVLIPSGRNDGTAICAPAQTPPQGSSRVGVVLENTDWDDRTWLDYQLVYVVVVAPADTIKPTNKPRRMWLALGALLCFFAVAVVLLKSSTHLHQPMTEPFSVEVSQQCKNDLDDAVHCRGPKPTSTKNMRCGFIADLEQRVFELSSQNSISWLSGSPSHSVLSTLTDTCKEKAKATSDNCSIAMVEHVCRQQFVPWAVDIGVCAAVASSRDLNLGGQGYSFVGNYSSSVGCYTYQSGKYSGSAFFSLWLHSSTTSGGDDIVPLHRWQPIRNSRVPTPESCTSSCPEGFRLHTSAAVPTQICEMKDERTYTTGAQNVTTDSSCLGSNIDLKNFPHLLGPAYDVTNMDQNERYRWAARCQFRWDECRIPGVRMTRGTEDSFFGWAPRQAPERMVGLRLRGAAALTSLPWTPDGDYMRVAKRCSHVPVYQLGGDGGLYVIYRPSQASYWVLGKSDLMGECNRQSYGQDDLQQVQVFHNTAIWPPAPSFKEFEHDESWYAKYEIDHEAVRSPVPTTPVMTHLFDNSQQRSNTAQITEILCDPNDLCCGVDCGGAGECRGGVCSFCDEKCANGHCLGEYSGDSCTFAPAYAIRGSRGESSSGSPVDVGVGTKGVNGVYVKIPEQFCAGAPVYRQLVGNESSSFFLYQAIDVPGAWVIVSQSPSLGQDEYDSTRTPWCRGNTADIVASSGGKAVDEQGLPLACVVEPRHYTVPSSAGVRSVWELIYPGCHHEDNSTGFGELQHYTGGDCAGSPDAAGCVGLWAERVVGQRNLQHSPQMSVIAVDATLATRRSFWETGFWCYGVDCGKSGYCNSDTRGACKCDSTPDHVAA